MGEAEIEDPPKEKSDPAKESFDQGHNCVERGNDDQVQSEIVQRTRERLIRGEGK